VLAALAGLAFALPRWRRNRDAADDGDPEHTGARALTDDDAARLDADIARYEV
jgi:hypothetical protein